MFIVDFTDIDCRIYIFFKGILVDLLIILRRIESDEYGKVVFDPEVIYPEVDNSFILKTFTLNICTQSKAE